MKVSLHEFAVDFVHNLHFQVKLEKCECHADAHNSIEIKASGKNNTKSTTELSPVLILDSSQIPEPRLHIKLLVGLSFHFQQARSSGECHAPLLLVLRNPGSYFDSTSVDAKNSAETMSTEGRFNSCLSKSSGWC